MNECMWTVEDIALGGEESEQQQDSYAHRIENSRERQAERRNSFTSSVWPSFLTEAFALLNSKQELLFEDFVFFVRRQIQPVEARVRTRQDVLLAVFFDAELLRPVGS